MFRILCVQGEEERKVCYGPFLDELARRYPKGSRYAYAAGHAGGFFFRKLDRKQMFMVSLCAGKGCPCWFLGRG